MKKKSNLLIFALTALIALTSFALLYSKSSNGYSKKTFLKIVKTELEKLDVKIINLKEIKEGNNTIYYLAEYIKNDRVKKTIFINDRNLKIQLSENALIIDKEGITQISNNILTFKSTSSADGPITINCNSPGWCECELHQHRNDNGTINVDCGCNGCSMTVTELPSE